MTWLTLLLVLLPAVAWAQPSWNYAPSSACKHNRVNAKGTGGADITVDATAGGVTVLDASTTRCGALIRNSSANDMRCGPTSSTVTASAFGTLIKSNEVLVLDFGAQEAWKCIRTGGADASANVTESIP